WIRPPSTRSTLPWRAASIDCQVHQAPTVHVALECGILACEQKAAYAARKAQEHSEHRRWQERARHGADRAAQGGVRRQLSVEPERQGLSGGELPRCRESGGRGAAPPRISAAAATLPGAGLRRCATLVGRVRAVRHASLSGALPAPRAGDRAADRGISAPWR